jgi:DNA-binding response OmpR family regulator
MATAVNAKILVIDDEDVMRGFVSAALQDAGFEVYEAADGEKGLALLQNVACNVVITDLLMPNKEGIETCRELRASNPEIEIIAISGAAEAPTYFAILKHMGVRAALYKPFSRDELLATVNSLLDE